MTKYKLNNFKHKPSLRGDSESPLSVLKLVLKKFGYTFFKDQTENWPNKTPINDMVLVLSWYWY